MSTAVTLIALMVTLAALAISLPLSIQNLRDTRHQRAKGTGSAADPSADTASDTTNRT